MADALNYFPEEYFASLEGHADSASWNSKNNRYIVWNENILREWLEEVRLDTVLTENESQHRRDRLRMTRIHDLLRREGFDGS